MSTQRNVLINFKGSVSNLMGSTRSATAMLGRMGGAVGNIGKMFTQVLRGNIKPLVNGVFSAVGKLASLFLVMPGFLMALVNPINVAHMAMANFSAAISAASPAEFVAATRNMAPAMKEAVMSVRLMEPQLKNLYGIIQQGFWTGFSADINQLARVYFPLLGSGLGGIATTLGNLRHQFMQFLLNPQVISAIQGWYAAFNSLFQAFGQMTMGMMPTLITMFSDFAKIMVALLPLIEGFVNMLARAVSFVTPLLTGVSNLLGGGIGGGSGGGGGSSGGGIGGFFSGVFHGITSFFSGLFGGGRAAGGPVMAGRSYLVGERGPEILSMGGSGFVHPSSSMGSGHTFVTVKIGETELRDMISHEISMNNQSIALASRMGRGQIV
jgi:hypothetical protein